MSGSQLTQNTPYILSYINPNYETFHFMRRQKESDIQGYKERRQTLNQFSTSIVMVIHLIFEGIQTDEDWSVSCEREGKRI